MEQVLEDIIRGRLDEEKKLAEPARVMVIAAGRSDEALAAALDGEAIPSETRSRGQAIDGRHPALLQSVRVEGFRGVGPAATLDISPGPGLTLVVGRNGSGKSSFAESLPYVIDIFITDPRQDKTLMRRCSSSAIAKLSGYFCQRRELFSLYVAKR